MPSEVAELFRVDSKTVTRWAVSGWIGSIRTPGGHRRYRESEIHQLLAALTEPQASSPIDREATPALEQIRKVVSDQ
jgi:excisionase family DNA binding protein